MRSVTKGERVPNADDVTPRTLNTRPDPGEAIHLVQSLIWILVDLDQEAAFDLVGLGASYLELQFIGALNEPVEVAQRMIDLCPELRQTFGSARRLGNELAKSKRVACFWQEDQVKQHRAEKS